MNQRLLINFKQRDRLSEFCANLAVASFTISVLPAAVGIDKPDVNAIILGVAAGLIFLLIGLYLLRRKYAN